MFGVRYANFSLFGNFLLNLIIATFLENYLLSTVNEENKAVCGSKCSTVIEEICR
jgi:hypothetical protein